MLPKSSGSNTVPGEGSLGNPGVAPQEKSWQVHSQDSDTHEG